MFLSDRESRGVIAVILATAAIIIAINLVVSPDGLPGWAAVAAIICAALAAGLWIWSWREQVSPNAPYKAEAEPVVTLAAAPEPVALPAPMAVAPEVVIVPEAVSAAPEVVIVPEPAPVAAASEVLIVSESEPVAPSEPAADEVAQTDEADVAAVAEEPIFESSEAAAAAVTPAPDQVFQAAAPDPTPAIKPDVVETEVELPAEPVPENENGAGSIARPEEPEETAEEAQDEVEEKDDTDAPETPPQPGEPAEASVTPPTPEPLDEASPVPPSATAYKPGEPDDLTRIEGIGPYYRDALAKLGITTFSQLALRTDSAAMVADLKANGYRQHPTISTWAEQAALAAAGDWEGLAKLQATLIGGRRGGD